jgi:hypothetical protein
MTSHFVSAVNQPERVFLSSFDDPTIVSPDNGAFDTVATNSYSRFRIQLKTPILNPERVQLLRSSIPNAQVSIPDYQIVFWYYRTPVAGGPSQLLNVRWYPSWTNPSANTFGCPINRIVSNYNDLLALMNQAAAAADDPATNPYHVANDITFSYDANTRKFSWTGTNALYTYDEAGYDDPLIKTQTANMRWFFRPVPFIQDTTMNLRLGFTLADTGVLFNIPGATFTAYSWADLVYTQNIILLANVIPGSSLGSGGQHNVLAVVPMNAPPLGVSLYSAPMVNWLTKVMKEIYEIEITMLDDNYQPYNVPNNAIVNIEMGYSYVKL